MGLYSLEDRRVLTPANGRYWIAPNAIVLGGVTLDEDVGIWFNAVIRGDNDPIRIGARTNIQDGCVLHSDPGFPLDVGPDCTVGHMVMLHGCTIGRGCLIGIGAIVLNGAKIGDECLIGAGALIPEGKEIPPRSVVLGAPGKIVRTVTADDLARIQLGGEVYNRRWRAYKTGLKPDQR
jgi:carbonic anhydrase/acetyltransferase-like protein (isoleucine patch superfamily)